MRLLLALCLSSSLLAHADDAPEDWASRPHEAFPGGEKAFQAVKQELLTRYRKADVTEDDLYRAAIEGMLSQIDPPMRRFNKLMPPEQAAALTDEMQGQLVGVGVKLSHDEATGRSEVLGVLAGSPAEKGGLREGDMLLSVEGHTFKGRPLVDVVKALRGREGERVSVAVLRDAAVLNVTLTRQKLSFEQVSFALLPSRVAVLTIRAFAEPTPAAVRAAIEKVNAAHAKGLVVDLRGNEGGLLDQAVATAKLLLPRGAVVTKLVRRGDKVEVLAQDGQPLLNPLPTVVLVDADTRSSGELVAAALRQGLKAPLIGTSTSGKWSVQELKELPNHFVLRFTVASFQAPDGSSYESTGLSPDIEVQLDEKSARVAERAKSVVDRLPLDGQLRAADAFLSAR